MSRSLVEPLQSGHHLLSSMQLSSLPSSFSSGHGPSHSTLPQLVEFTLIPPTPPALTAAQDQQKRFSASLSVLAPALESPLDDVGPMVIPEPVPAEAVPQRDEAPVLNTDGSVFDRFHIPSAEDLAGESSSAPYYYARRRSLSVRGLCTDKLE